MWRALGLRAICFRSPLVVSGLGGKECGTQKDRNCTFPGQRSQHRWLRERCSVGTITFDGRGTANGSTSPVVALSVVDFTLTANPTTAAVSAAGGSGTATLIVTSLGGFNETLTYTCAGLPAEATCTFAAGSAANFETLTIQTTADSVRVDRGPFHRGRGSSYAMLATGLLGLLVLPMRRRPWHPRTTRLLGVLAILGVSCLWFPACGGGSTTPTNPGTPTGTSKVTVTAASSGRYVLSHSATVTLTIR